MSNEPTIQKDSSFQRIRTTDTTQEDSFINNSIQMSSSKKKLSGKKKKTIEFIYATPAIKQNKELKMPPTPHKENNSRDFENFITKGKNLMEIFESL